MRGLILCRLNLFAGTTFWLTTFLTVIMLMVPVLAWRFYSFDSHPSLVDKIRMKQRQTKLSRSKPEMLRTPSSRRSRRSLRSSYAFAHEVWLAVESFWSTFHLINILGRIRPTHHFWQNYADQASPRLCVPSRPWH